MKAKLTVALVSLCLFFVYKAEAQTKRRPPPRNPSAAITTPTGLTYLITKKGTGRQLKAGDTAILNYTGTLTNGVKFDSSHDRQEPFAFKLGAGQVIKGWDEGVAKLRVGDHAILVIPGKLAYGSRGVPNIIPPDSTLIFIVEVVDVKATSLTDVLLKTLTEKGLEAMIAEFHSLRSAGNSDVYIGESDINSFGYRLLKKNQVNEAIAVFKMNVEAYPKSANAYDSLAEAYLIRGDKDKAIENYKSALAIDPAMESSKQALRKLTGP